MTLCINTAQLAEIVPQMDDLSEKAQVDAGMDCCCLATLHNMHLAVFCIDASNLLKSKQAIVENKIALTCLSTR